MADRPYHWRDLAADERKADEIRALLNMPNLKFEPVLAEMSAVIPEPPTVEIQDRLKRMGCELRTDALLRTNISFTHHRHLADSVLVVLGFARYALVAVCAAMLVETLRSAHRSEFFWGF